MTTPLGAELKIGGVTVGLPRTERIAIVVGLSGVAGLAWIYLITDAARMADTGTMAATAALIPWTVVDFGLMFAMWTVMMVAMMLPSAATTVLIYGSIVGKIAPGQPILPSVAAFTGGYLCAWTGFSAIATIGQWGLESAALLSPMMVSTSPELGALVLVFAGLYQFSPTKDACLTHCQSPFAYLASHWRPGLTGALTMGAAHGIYCIGCCWAIMGLLFVGGVMNLLWVAALAALVFIEKTAASFGPGGRAATGTLAIAAGVMFLLVS